MSSRRSEIYVRILKEKYKYIPNIEKLVNEGFYNSPKSIQLFKFIAKNRRKKIPNKIIQLFYDNPEKFFSSCKILLANKSLYNNCGNSIFALYFDVLNSNNKAKIEVEIYEKNFEKFFKDFGKELANQDYALETSLHKLAKLRNKNLFFKICKKLYEIGVLNEELLSIKNVDSKSCYDFIIGDIIENKKKIVQNNNEFQAYKNFIEYYPNLKNSLNDNEKLILTSFLSKLILDEQNYKEIEINETIERLKSFLNDLNDKKIFFKYIFYPYSGINQLNLLYELCSTEEEFNQLYNLVIELSKIKIEKKIGKNKNNKKNNDELYNQCVAQHISYVMRNMKEIKGKGNNFGINYGLKLLEKIIPILLENNKSKESYKLIYENCSPQLRDNIYFNKGILSNLIFNQNLNLDKKIDIFKKYCSQLNLNLMPLEIRYEDEYCNLFYFFIN